MQVSEQFSGQNIVFVGLTPDGAKDVSDTEAFIADTGITWSVAYGAAETMQALDVTLIPAKFVFGTDGKLVWQDGQSGDIASAIQSALGS